MSFKSKLRSLLLTIGTGIGIGGAVHLIKQPIENQVNNYFFNKSLDGLDSTLDNIQNAFKKRIIIDGSRKEHIIYLTNFLSDLEQNKEKYEKSLGKTKYKELVARTFTVLQVVESEKRLFKYN
ncbi:MAG TPA: hypothetical protein VJI68_01925 [Candidatus Nanoarchaeia archaeon]|nr:hypothetical protein [Candidatus Nanoarchaeia archaeon]